MMKKLLCTLLFTVLAVGFVNAQADVNLQGNGNDIADGSTTPLLSDHTDFGDVSLGTSFTRTFTIQNTGTGDLNLTGPGVAFNFGSNSQFGLDFAGTFTPINVTPTTFDVVMTATTLGVANAVVNVTTDDPDAAEQSYTFAITANVTAAAPDVNLQGNGVDIADGDTTPDLADHTDFGDVSLGSSFTRTFTIQNTGGGDINLTGPGVAFNFGSNSQFGLDFAGTFTPINVTPTTFDVVMTATTLGVANAVVNVTTDDPDAAEQSYTFSITANVTAPAPDVNLQGNGVDIADGDTTPDLADHTDFGDVSIGSSFTRTFTIQNTGAGDLNLTGPGIAFNFGSNAQFGLDFAGTTTPITNVTPTTFDVVFTATTLGVANAVVNVTTDDPDAAEQSYTFSITANVTSATPDVNLQGNGVDIADGDTTPDLGDHTDFGDVDVGTSFTRTFTIQNTGGGDLNLTGSGVAFNFGSNSQFSLDLGGTFSPITNVTPTTFDVIFTPTGIGPATAVINVTTDDPDAAEQSYTFTITANGTTPVSTGEQLLITQYYEGESSEDNWIEVKNISTAATVPGSYYLCLFADLNGTTVSDNINTNAPDESILIPVLQPGEVVLFKRNSSSLLPSSGNLGSPTATLETEVCSFNGNDVILISNTNEAGAGHIDNRVDIIGVIGTGGVAVTWGPNISIIKGCGTTEVPSKNFDATVDIQGIIINDYITLTLDEVDDANPATNVALGTQTVGVTTFTTSWDNGDPDRTKNTVIDGAYANSNGSFEACNLTINAGGSIDLNSNGVGSNYVLVNEDLSINGTFTIGDTDALVMVDPLANIIGTITKTEITTPLNNFRDFTYWSSPVAGAAISTFTNTGVDASRIFQWDKPSIESAAGGGWTVANGTMETARGYISEGPTGITPGGTHTVTFQGTPNNGTLPIALGNLNDGFVYTDYNLIGNPYPSAIDIDAFILLIDNEPINNNTMDGTIYLWTHTTQISGGTTGEFVNTDYAVYNLSGGSTGVGGAPAPTSNIGSGQGFMVRSIESVSGNEDVFFQNDMRIKGENTQFYKNKNSEEKNRLWLDMTSEEGAFNQILVGFFDEATDGVDRGYDGLKFNGGNYLSFYSKIEEDQYAIQGLGTFDQSKEVTLGFNTGLARKFKIEISKMEGVLVDEEIYLVDNALNVVHDLKQAPYEFEITEIGVYGDRFTLKFNGSTLGNEDFELNNGFIVYNESNTLKVKASQDINTIEVYDMLGRLITKDEPNASVFDLNTQSVKSGTVLIVNATMTDGSTISRKAIKL